MTAFLRLAVLFTSFVFASALRSLEDSAARNRAYAEAHRRGSVYREDYCAVCLVLCPSLTVPEEIRGLRNIFGQLRKDLVGPFDSVLQDMVRRVDLNSCRVIANTADGSIAFDDCNILITSQ